LTGTDTIEISSAEKQFAMIPLADLHIPPYQPSHRRGNTDAVTQRIIDNFDPEALGPLLVSFRDDKYWVMDGQRRLSACLAVGYREPLACYILRGLTETRETAVWGWLDNRSNQHIVDRYHGMVTARTPRVATQIESILQRHGYMVDYNYGPTTISGVKALEILHLWESLSTVLSVLRKTWQGDGRATVPTMLMALGAFDICYREYYLESDLAHSLEHQSPHKMVQDAIAKRRERKSDRYLGTTLWATLAIDIRVYYNQYVGKLENGRNLRLPEFRQPPVPHDQLVIARPIQKKRREA